jgi:pimeloyl-ACP methyl ester carboxylesterase
MSCLVCAALVSACTPPVAIKHLAPREAQLALTANVLTTGEPSNFSQIILRKYDLLGAYAERPDEALAALRAATSASPENDELFALAELSYTHADRSAGQPYYLAAALYAYALLFPGAEDQRLDPIDSRTRVATDIYNRAVAEAFSNGDETEMVPAAGSYALPFGQMDVAFDSESLSLGDARFVELLRIADYEVRGFQNRYRKAGIGAPVAPRLDAPEGSLLRRYTSPHLRVPGTVLLTFSEPRRQIAADSVSATVEFYPFSNDAVVTIDERELPLESEPTAALAASLAESRFWKFEMARFFGRIMSTSDNARLGAIEPLAGRTPVIFVHGTNSSPPRWADMVNDLMNDPAIHRRYSFWFFSYMSSQPIALSAREFRLALIDAMQLAGAAGKSDCIQQMVVVGHSQGGLLTKMTVIDSGDQLWRHLSREPLEQANLPPETKKIVQEALFIEPLPFVRRVVFIATPHHGSYLAGPQLVRRLIARFVTLPIDIVRTATSLAAATAGYRSAESTVSLERVPTSIDNMSPGNPFIRVLAEIPVAPGVVANSIIPVKEGYEPYEEGNDGVVEYKSAHIDDVESELVVRSTHSTQSNPHTIEEVRRILMKHAQEFPCTPPPLQAQSPRLPPRFGE